MRVPAGGIETRSAGMVCSHTHVDPVDRRGSCFQRGVGLRVLIYRFEPYRIVRGGVLAAFCFGGAQMLIAVLTNGAGALLRPLHAAGTLLVGGDASRLNSRDLVAVTAAATLLIVISVLLAFVFAAATALMVRRTMIVLVGVAFAVTLWFGAIYIAAPLLNARRVPDRTSAMVQLLVFTAGYGVPLSAYLTRQRLTVPPAANDAR